jgi:ribonucleoside-diphosphate reductase alpha chain
MSNKNLINQIYHLARSHSLDVSLNRVKHPSKLATVIPYTINVPKIKSILDQTIKYYEDDRVNICKSKIDSNYRNQSSSIKINNQKFIRIQGLEITDRKPEYVYTLGVEDDHSYSVEGLVCENCFLLGMDDSIDGIFKTISGAGKISKWAGGIGIHISNIRALGSLIRGTNGNSDGIIPLVKVLNSVARYVNQGGRRNGAIALYIEPWHSDVFSFCELKQNTGAEELRARDIFLALWVPDLFMKRVRDGGYWSLMCPDECPGLADVYGEEFEKLYLQYEEEGRYKRRVKAEDLWYHITSNQIETGMPYMLFKDNANRQSNQKNLGTIKSSNLCSEIIEYSDADEYAVCNLCSICLPRFIETDTNGNKSYNYDKLLEVSKVCTKNLDKIIDINYYPVPEAERSNMKHRPIGIGVQGLADVYCMLDLPFDSAEANTINKKIFETIYYGALLASCENAKKKGAYSTFKGSPFSKGQLQYHLWGLTEEDLLMGYDWKSLVNDIKKYGTRNSLLTAVMPTASTSQIMTNNECIEPYTSNLYTRTTLAGEYIVVNKHLIEKLISLGLWTKEIQEEFFFDNGSIQNIKVIPDEIKEVFKTAYEMRTKPIIDQAIGRGPFIDQSQSMNLFSNEPDFDMLTKSHFYSWSNKLKTGMYYLRSRPSVDPIKFGLDPDARNRIKKKRSGYTSNSSDDESEEENDNRDPRRISEIEINHGSGKTQTFKSSRQKRADNYLECDMCSG